MSSLLLACVGLSAKPITGPLPVAFPAKDLCSNCGLCKSAVGVASVVDACAFLAKSAAEALWADEKAKAAEVGREKG